MKKRKRVSKKGKGKKKPKVMEINEDVNTQNDDSVVEEEEEAESSDGGGSDSGGGGEDAEAPASTVAVTTDQAPPKQPATTSAGGFSDSTAMKAVYRRVKVKIKTSRSLLLDASPETQTQAEKSSQQSGLEKQEGVSSEKIEEDSAANSLSEANNNVSPSVGGDLLKKSTGIKIKSKSFTSNFSPCINTETLNGEKTPKKEPSSVAKGSSRYNKKELDASLEVIKKVMKMDAAEPFNTPVDPIALGIPDYFEVIDTPMDFGTIRNNLESGVKYSNSEDVYKDVQCIWDNCYKYNNKGDLVLDLMKRVKKNFSKYWLASPGLYNDYTQGVESSQIKDATPPDSSGKESLKGGSSLTNNKSRKLHGLKKHKTSCLCAICVMIRRRQEREESAAKIVEEEQMEAASSDCPDEVVKPEETTPAGSVGGECASPNMESSSPPEVDMDSSQQEKVGEEAKLAAASASEEEKPDGERGTLGKKESQISALMELGGGPSSRSVDDDHPIHQKRAAECGNHTLNHSDKETLQIGGETEQQQKAKEKKLDKYQKAKMLEKLRYLDNPGILGLCSTLFAANHNNRSVWNGPHSLFFHQNEPSTSSTHIKKRSSIRDAVSQLMQRQGKLLE
ncbi:unnamed protein product [Cuscuta europaea]|uniref:Bromo domain-containing protein n=1 Tax=Cuscuta europaea TaxID=41803 RepID=A0A9P1DXX7_CUSEU|nr:unnamed protein product [Cuscuta europaea]